MKDIVGILPEKIDTTVLVVILFFIYKSITFVLKLLKKKKEAEQKLIQEALDKERMRTKFEARMSKVESVISYMKVDMDKDKADYKEAFIGVTEKIDKIYDLLIHKK